MTYCKALYLMNGFKVLYHVTYCKALYHVTDFKVLYHVNHCKALYHVTDCKIIKISYDSMYCSTSCKWIYDTI